MKQLSALITALVLAATAPALAQYHPDQHQNQHGGGRPPQHRPMPPRNGNPHHYREGQVWNGHHLANRGGHWGYYQPRNGAQVFINIPL
jgi:hypothetical protein